MAKPVTLVSSDGKSFVVSEEAAAQSTTIKHMAEDSRSDEPIPVPDVSSKILSQVIVYLERNAADADQDAGKGKGKEEDLVAGLSTSELLEFLLAAHYLNIRGLVPLISQKIADAICNKSPAAVSKIFGMESYYSPEEEEKTRNEYPWVFDDIEDD